MADEILKVALSDDGIATLTMNRPGKRNAMSDELLAALDGFFSAPPEGVKAVVLTGTAGHYCSGLDLSEHVARDAEGTMRHSRGWHAIMDRIQFGGLPVVSAMFGAVIGGGLELATATHVRIAEPSTIFQLPEGRRGIFVGGGASVRVGRILGADRMIEMMLTGRKYNAAEGLAYTNQPGCAGGPAGLPAEARSQFPLRGEAMARDAALKPPPPAPAISDATLREFTGYNMKRAFMVIQADVTRTLEPFGLRMVTYSALAIVGDNPGLSQSQLAAALAIERPNLVVIVDELEGRDLVNRDRVPTDRRTYALRLTTEGARLLARATEAVRGHEARMIAGIGKSEEATLIACLNRIEASETGRN